MLKASFLLGLFFFAYFLINSASCLSRDSSIFAGVSIDSQTPGSVIVRCQTQAPRRLA